MKKMMLILYSTLLCSCASITVEKVVDGEGEGVSFYMPKTLMKLVPDEKLGYTVEWEIIADTGQEYRIRQDSTWAISDFEIKTHKGMLKLITSKEESDDVGMQLVDQYKSLKEAETETEIAILEALRTKAEGKLIEAKTKRDNIKTLISTLETEILALTENIQTAEIDVETKKKKLEVAKQRLEIAKQQLKEAEALPPPNQTAVKAENENVLAKTAELITAEQQLKIAEQTLNTHLSQKELKEKKLEEQRVLLAEANDEVTRLESSLPRKQLKPNTGDSPNTRKNGNKRVEIPAPVVFSLEVLESNVPYLRPLTYRLLNNESFHQISLESIPSAETEKDGTKRICSGVSTKPEIPELQLRAEMYLMKFSIECDLPQTIIPKLKSRHKVQDTNTQTTEYEELSFNKDDSSVTKEGYTRNESEGVHTLEVGIPNSFMNGDKEIFLKTICSNEELTCSIIFKDPGKKQTFEVYFKLRQ